MQIRLVNLALWTLADGNVYLASLGYEVVTVDQSEVELAKVETLAALRGVKIKTIVAELAEFIIELNLGSKSSLPFVIFRQL